EGVAEETPYDPLGALRADRAHTRRALVRARALALARLGRREEALSPLAEVVREAPRDEEALAELLRCEGGSSHNDWFDPVGVRWALTLACLQLGRVDEAEYWYGLASLDQRPETIEALSSVLGARAEIALARGRVEAGLRLWRRTAEEVRPSDADPFMAKWSLEVRAGAVAAHALHGRVDQVAGLVRELRGLLPGLPPGSTYGAVLLAVALAGLAEGDAGAVRLVALSELVPVARDFPALSSVRAREAAERVDAVGYARARDEYGELGRDAALQCLGSLTNSAFDQT
ncbi:BTAD domain-containing putative transcriptional regulator, partial [Streptomyces acidiscabies]|uniref:BTAD domain-containing putative transcriptional regulator n=1 Tax=Streptomyces acidiscabies TaxID=42234 RepID=UPI00273D78ED